MTRLAIVGASGRMGRAIVRLAHDAGLELACAIGSTDLGRDAGELAGIARAGVAITTDLSTLASARADVVIDFSSPTATRATAEIAMSAGSALVSGTTGLDDEAKAALLRAEGNIPVLWEPNMSVGVHVLGELIKRAAAALGPDFDIEIVEAHHRRKVDAPSGTALRLAEKAREGRADASRLVNGREGRPGAREPSELGMHAVRGGDVVGDHTAHFLGTGERIELTHRATSRDVFAQGAVRAALWIAGKPRGRYTLADVVAEALKA